MKTFYAAEEIEALAAQGVRELTVDENTVLTALAREAANQLGIRLVSPGNHATRSVPAVTAGANPGKPRGCQHGPLTLNGDGQHATSNGRGSGGSPIVDELIGAVKQMAKRLP